MHGLCQEVALEWLTEAEVGQYLGARFAGRRVPAELVRLVAQRTDGNPLFLTTMVDYLLRQGWVAVVAGQVAVTVGLASAGQSRCRTASGSSSSCSWSSSSPRRNGCWRRPVWRASSSR